MNRSKTPILVIVGPTGTGKTSLAASILKSLQGEIISADSRQVYKSLDYTTNKLRVGDEATVSRHDGYWLQDDVRINLYDVIDITRSFSVGEYVDMALLEIDRITKNDRLPIVVGGSGFYADGLLGISPISAVGVDYRLRESLQELSVKELQSRLLSIDPNVLKRLNTADSSNKQRLIRFIEIAEQAGSVGKGIYYSPLQHADIDVLFIGLTSSREYLYRKADDWVNELFHTSVFRSEIELVATTPNVSPVLKRGFIYNEGLMHLNGELPLKDAITRTQFRLHQYIKRQMVWFKRNNKIHWFDITDPGFKSLVFETVEGWYHS
ncbi:tRNA (adenosine(37)-N6)-dimethylallyltransferase MiaA [candidate division WWE3 bacterium]|uniref:tRNA dimethylallyltransferase n=1 Tax=candidate division WWE3 bacterium TaxID=2053526 RepID=A0A955RQM8_UNCKA|nr:tRNA (adenosine(37)-N6)-dimethylallyltransferase MiaA [candidate division WWE3 bacterium]